MAVRELEVVRGVMADLAARGQAERAEMAALERELADAAARELRQRLRASRSRTR